MVTFDEAIPAACTVLRAHLGSIPDDALVIRDVSGAVTIVLNSATLERDGTRASLSKALHEALGAYSPGGARVLFSADELIDPQEVTESSDVHIWSENVGGGDEIRVLDRLLTNQDWLRPAVRKNTKLPVLVAFSIKGGVGRSTALAVLGIHLAKSGKKVVLVDLDLEAPGVASMLTASGADFGVTDWMAEALVGQADAELLANCLAPWVANPTLDGSLHVLPASGEKSKSYVSKVGRVYLPTLSDAGDQSGFAERVNTLVEQLESMDRFDVILIDSRAGLHDIGSAVVTRLGAKVLMFARDDVQTWQGYGHLFSHLRTGSTITWQGDDDLRWRLKMVAAQLALEERAREQYLDRSYETWIELYDEELAAGDTEAFSYARDDEQAPHFPMIITFDTRVRGFDFSAEDKLPAWDLVVATYGAFLKGAEGWIFDDE